MSWGVALRNSAALGLGGIPALLNASSFYPRVTFNFLSGQLDPKITFTRASTGTYFNSSGVLSSAAIDAPRFDYNPVTLAPLGLLIEEYRTNICLYSSDLNQLNWLKGASVSLTYNTTAAPDGTTTADTITVITGVDTGVYQSIACSSSTSYTFSLWVKLGTMAASDYKIAIYDNTNAAFIASNISPTQTLSSTAWTRVTYTFTTPATCVSIRAYCFRNSLSASTSVNVWGMQVEQGAFATSYVPTTTTALTRASDVASITGTNFSSWYNQTQGTFYVEYQGVPSNLSATRRAFEIGNTGSSANRHVVGYLTPTDSRYFVTESSSTQAIITVNGINQGQIVKASAAYVQNNFSHAASGLLGTPDTVGNVPTVSAMWLGSDETRTSGNIMLNGYIRSFKYYPTRLSDGALQLLTS
jgi:hypothetical protein